MIAKRELYEDFPDNSLIKDSSNKNNRLTFNENNSRKFNLRSCLTPRQEEILTDLRTNKDLLRKANSNLS